MRIYLASRYERAMEMYDYAVRLAGMGHDVTSRWIHHAVWKDKDPLRELRESVNANQHSIPMEAASIASEDIVDIYRADLVVCFTEQPASGYGRGGRHVEFGIALAYNKKLATVGPRENNFYTLPNANANYDTFEEMVDDLPVIMDDASEWNTHVRRSTDRLWLEAFTIPGPSYS